MIKSDSVYLSGFVFDPVAWAEESYEAAIEIYKVSILMMIDARVSHL